MTSCREADTGGRVYQTDDWKLGAYLQWRPLAKVLDCPRCQGRREVGGGFKDLDGIRQCPECFGAGIKTVLPDESTKPPVPADLAHALHAVWKDYFGLRDDDSYHGEGI
jgi:hypothetical protein